MPKQVKLWGGLHDGGIIKLPHTADEYVTTTNGQQWTYRPQRPEDYLMNLFRYQPEPCSPSEQEATS